MNLLFLFSFAFFFLLCSLWEVSINNFSSYYLLGFFLNMCLSKKIFHRAERKCIILAKLQRNFLVEVRIYREIYSLYDKVVNV